ncbi:hypothetical protein FA15DRAFT_672195 [Coprinopsis marcescibilis]|uniref:RRM domain-containing protein n=1 Tax=Coprinopsis marcescibilis TaxID=230819 RepID=A0A5C3KPP0_COPMA|nr:hypothetical protein FA15DRAFT_672195 [Coprinopsis marcescibilis]
MVLGNATLNANGGYERGVQGVDVVQVQNLPDHVELREVVALFRSLIGEIVCFKELRENGRPSLEITFENRDLALKALCMNGYSMSGTTLQVAFPRYMPIHQFSLASERTAESYRSYSPPQRRSRNSTDDRRNLYVLGLPFALTKTEFTALFSRYGTVVHNVILATVDNSSRRRGFVVMSTHEEARRALTALTRTQIKGHTIDVSWAVVQRSQGFLDGGDRTMLLDARPSQISVPTHLERPTNSSSSSDCSEYSPVLTNSDPLSIVISPLPTAAILINNLPAMLFSQVQDIHPLVCPYGSIEKLETVQIATSETVSAVVQYGTTDAAMEARNLLNGQRYDTMRRLEIHFIHPIGMDNARDLRPGSEVIDSGFDDLAPLYPSRTSSPFFGHSALTRAVSDSPRSGDYYGYKGSRSRAATPAPFSNGLKDRYEGRSTAPSSRSGAGSPRNMFHFNQGHTSRRTHGGFSHVFSGFTA